MVKVTIEDSHGANEVSGNAIFAIVPDTENTSKVGNIVCTDGKIDKRAVALSLAELVENTIDTISEDNIEIGLLTLMFLSYFEKLEDKRIGATKSENPFDDVIDILRKAGI